MKKIILILFLLLGQIPVFCQDIVFSKSARIRFFSSTPLENIEATTHEASTFLNIQKGEIVFSMLIKSFRFEKALMEEHFNENYMESDRYPKAMFKGNILNLHEIHFSKDGNYTARISGDLTIHGQSRKVEVQAKFIVKQGKLSGNSEFKIKPADYGIKIPSIVKGKIAEEIEVFVNSNYEPYKK